MPIDRRVAKTRTALFDALVRLIGRQDYDRITVEDILREAQVGRSTFYAHFVSKDDLLARSLDRLKSLLVAARDGHPEKAAWPIDPNWDPCRTLFEHVGQFSGTHLALAGGRGAPIVRKAIESVLKDVLGKLPPASANMTLPGDLVVEHIVSTFNAVLVWWLEHRPELSAAQADGCFRQLLLNEVPRDAYRPFLAEEHRDRHADGV